MKNRRDKRRNIELLLISIIVILTVYQIWIFVMADLKFDEWKYSTKDMKSWYLDKINDEDWMFVNLPFEDYFNKDILFFRGTLFVPERRYAKSTFFVDDCVEKVYVNEKLAFSYPDCGSCTHCSGIEIDLSKFVKNGKNSIAVEVRNIKNTRADFDVKKVETGLGLWILISVLIGILMAMKLEKNK